MREGLGNRPHFNQNYVFTFLRASVRETKQTCFTFYAKFPHDRRTMQILPKTAKTWGQYCWKLCGGRADTVLLETTEMCPSCVKHNNTNSLSWSALLSSLVPSSKILLSDAGAQNSRISGVGGAILELAMSLSPWPDLTDSGPGDVGDKASS